MSDLELGLEGLKLAASGVLLFLGTRVARSAILSNWRQDLFAIRNELWDRLRAEGCLDTRRHRGIRDVINGMIRLGPSLNLLTLVAGLLVVRRSHRLRAGEKPVLGSDAERMPTDAAQQAVLKAEAQLLRSLIQRIGFETLPGAIIGWPLWFFWRVVRVFRGVRSSADWSAHVLKMKVRHWAAELEHEVQEVGKAEAAFGVTPRPWAIREHEVQEVGKAEALC